VTTEVHDAPERSRYEATVDGTLAGFAEYRDVDGARVFTHTVVLDEYEGQGVGTALVRAALDAVRADGGRIVPVCRFVTAFIRRNPDYADLIDRAVEANLHH
jgi:hypothetical protein